MRKLYLTKNRKKMLHTALSMDDVLYRKFEVMRKEIDDYAKHLQKTYKNVIRVHRQVGNVLIVEQIIDVQKLDGEGIFIKIK